MERGEEVEEDKVIHKTHTYNLSNELCPATMDSVQKDLLRLLNQKNIDLEDLSPYTKTAIFH
jgi:hypothetical protein